MLHKGIVSKTEKLAYLHRWYSWFFERTDSWENGLSTDMAYLIGAILNDLQMEITTNSEMVRLLRKHEVHRSDPIWAYLKFTDN